jgi:hypothetical protein
MRIDPDTLDAQVPNLLPQPLVETPSGTASRRMCVPAALRFTRRAGS